MTTSNFGKVAATPTNREMHFGGTQQLQLSNGNIVHVWLDDANTEGERTIWARVFKPNGEAYPSPQGDEFQVNEWDGGDPSHFASEKNLPIFHWLKPLMVASMCFGNLMVSPMIRMKTPIRTRESGIKRQI